MKGKIVEINGIMLVATELNAALNEIVMVGEQNLLGEVTKIVEDTYYIQLYEEPEGLRIGDAVVPSGELLNVELGPGLIGNVFSGLQKPLEALSKKSIFIQRGISVAGLDHLKKWEFKQSVTVGDVVEEGSIIGTVQETPIIAHKIMVPKGVSGKVVSINSGNFTVDDVVAVVSDGKTEKKIKMMHKWPVKISRPIRERVKHDEILFTGQRILDCFFPLLKGGSIALPGGFGSGKTILQQSFVKFADVDITIYVGCGERGSEIADLIESIRKIVDKKTNRPVLEKSILVTNTSNMPVIAREASIYTGITMAEYYRDMGYDVLLIADSTSRWAEALRELSARLGELPAEAGYPAYLPSYISEFYSRTGKAAGLSKNIGSVSVIGSVSPPGGDITEPVTQNTLAVTGGGWVLNQFLAYQRFFPAVEWSESFSNYQEEATIWRKKIAEDWQDMIVKSSEMVEAATELEELSKIIGLSSLSPENQVNLNTYGMLREGFLRQSAFDENDNFCEPQKQYWILKILHDYHNKCLDMIKTNKPRHVVKGAIENEIINLKRLQFADFMKQKDILLKRIQELKPHE